MSTRTPLRIGTRGSPLALAQARLVREALAVADPALAAEGAVEIVVVRTTGDRVLDRPLAEIGGKGLFTKEIEEGLLDRTLDLAVHSMKDVPTLLPDGLVIAATLPRADPRDALIADGARGIADLPRGAVVGTASLRRGAQLLARRPDLRVVPLRGNVQTRLRKLAEGEVAATFLAVAGLERLGLGAHVSAALEPDEMLPAVAQGAVGVEARAGDGALLELLARINHAPTLRCVIAERAFLAVLEGSCRTPIAALAELAGGRVRFRGLVARPDGTGLRAVDREAAEADAEATGAVAGADMRAALPADFFAA
jgi:hydroxymethylbilane synthase